MAPSVSMEGAPLPTYFVLHTPSIWLSSLSFIISFHKLVNISVAQSSVRHSNKLVTPKERALWNLQPIAGWSETQGLQLASKVCVHVGMGASSAQTSP